MSGEETTVSETCGHRRAGGLRGYPRTCGRRPGHYGWHCDEAAEWGPANPTPTPEETTVTDTPASTADRCPAAVNYQGEHIGCDEPRGHTSWPHGNTEHGTIWRGENADAQGCPAPTPDPRTVTVDADDLREAAAVLSAIPALHGLRDRLLAALDRTEGEQR